MIKLSAIVIAKNEEERIGRCLESLAFCDERVIVDNSSTDNTVIQAKKKGAQVLRSNSESFSQLRDLGRAKATGDWLLYIDADEQVTPELAREIIATVNAWKPGLPVGYELERVNYYLGALWPTTEWMLRLFRKDAFISWLGELHETPRVTGNIGKLSTTIVHDTHRTLADMVEKTNKWSQVEAKLRFRANHPRIVVWRLVRVMITGFFDSFVMKKGYRAGTVGLIESIYQGFSVFITYAKLWEMQKKKS